MEKCLKKLKGHSGSQVYLIERDGYKLVRKVGNVTRNYERMTNLKGVIPLPEIISYDGETLEMEYIHGMDMRTYLTHHSTNKLIDFLGESFDAFHHLYMKDYTSTYHDMLSWVQDIPEIPFDHETIIERLEKVLPFSQYHGDMTLENILWNGKQFIWIDPVTVAYDSSSFDAAKLRQDLECKWFLRHNPVRIEGKLQVIQNQIYKWYPHEKVSNDFLILMLLRVYLHCRPNTLEFDFVVKEINRLWKL